jgi:MscS family membrane protein
MNDPFALLLTGDWRDVVVRILIYVALLGILLLLRGLVVRLVLNPLRKKAEAHNTKWALLLLDETRAPMRLIVIGVALLIGTVILNMDFEVRQVVERIAYTFFIIAFVNTLFSVVDLFLPSSLQLFRLTGMVVNERLIPFIRTGGKILIGSIGAVTIIGQWGLDVSGLVAALGVGGLGISLAAQDTIGNLFGFTTIVGDQPFTVGDFIKSPDVEGIVESVGVRSTRVRQLDQAFVTVPNNKLANSAVLNWSRLSKRWINVTLRIRFDAKRADVVAFLEKTRAMLNARPFVERGSVVVRFINFGDSGLEIMVRCYVLHANWDLFTAEKETIFLDLLQLLEESGLNIALPSQSLYIERGTAADLTGGNG